MSRRRQYRNRASNSSPVLRLKPNQSSRVTKARVVDAVAVDVVVAVVEMATANRA